MIDPGPNLCDKRDMIFLRTLVLWAAMALILPWGAFAGGHGADGFAARSMAVLQQSSASTGDHAMPAPELRAKRGCHGPAMVGSPCQPDNVLLPISVGLTDLPTGLRLWPAEAIRRDGRAVLAILDPPKPV